MAKKNYAELADQIIALVGTAENISFATHCMTRLRLEIKDQSIVKVDEIKNIPGLLGAQWSGGQFQVIVGADVPKLYAEVCNQTGLAMQAAVDENLDAPKEKLTPKVIGKKILDYMSGSMVALIPIMCGAGLLKAVMVLLGPTLLNVISEQSDTYLLLNLIYNAAFYFLPVYVGYSAAKKIGASPLMGLYLGAILVVPDLVNIASSGEGFAPFGLEMVVGKYGQTVVPMLLGVFALYWVEKFFKKIIPDTVSLVFTPFCTIAVASVVTLYLLAPLGNVLGSYVNVFMQFMAKNTGFVGVAVIAGLWQFLVMTGMHQAVIPMILAVFVTTGADSCVLVGATLGGFGAYGMALGATIAAKTPAERSANFGLFLSGILGGIGEPSMFGVGMRYMRPFIAMVIANVTAGAYAGIMGVQVHIMGANNFLRFLQFSGGTVANLIHGSIALLIALFGSAALTVIIGLEPKKKSQKA